MMKRNINTRNRAVFVGLHFFLTAAISALAGTSGWLTYEIIGESVTIIDCSQSASGSLEIPAELEGKPVTCIGNYAFDWCSSLTQISIPPGVTSISKGTFAQCSSLTNIIIPDSVASIGLGAFSYCSSLPGITLPSGVTNIEQQAFWECSSLTSITLPAGISKIAEYAFWECTSLLDINITSNVMDIGDHAFAGCIGLTDLMAEVDSALACSFVKLRGMPHGIVSWAAPLPEPIQH